VLAKDSRKYNIYILMLQKKNKIQWIPGELAPEVETLDTENSKDFLESGACEILKK
jgi:hypothetical protein